VGWWYASIWQVVVVRRGRQGSIIVGGPNQVAIAWRGLVSSLIHGVSGLGVGGGVGVACCGGGGFLVGARSAIRAQRAAVYWTRGSLTPQPLSYRGEGEERGQLAPTLRGPGRGLGVKASYRSRDAQGCERRSRQRRGRAVQGGGVLVGGVCPRDPERVQNSTRSTADGKSALKLRAMSASQTARSGRLS